MEEILLVNGKATATVLAYAAHVTAFQVGGRDLIFLSKSAVFKPPTAIRGGVPLIWPQFSDRGPLSKHGFARTKLWKVVERSETNVTLQLEDDEETRKSYPGFRVLYHVELLPSSLKLSFTVEPKDQPLEFTFALHSYFCVDDISKTQVIGLEGTEYQNNVRNLAIEKEIRSVVSFEEETDRVYLNVPRELSIVPGSSEGKIVLKTMGNIVDAVVWNPWREKSKKMGDFGDEEYKNMVCVEVGNVAQSIKVGKGESWCGEHEICWAPQISSL